MGTLESERGFLEQARHFVFEMRTHNSLVYPAEDVHRRLQLHDEVGES
jgi:GTP diphosphokinase / guanosine-3',5'-bis(diphosphate) 3'-diphosphatase